jgi:sulfur carrier protein
MRIRINGEGVDHVAASDLQTVLGAHATTGEGVAVAVNRQLVPRARWGQTCLVENDEIDVFRVIAGG